MFKLRTILMLAVTFGLGGLWSLKAIEQRFGPAPDMVDALGATNYSEIEKGLFMGGLVGKAPPGVEAVLNLCDYADRYRLKHEEWMPIPDGEPAPSLDWLRDAVKFVDENRKKDRPTYVHCYAGISRSGMVVMAYLMQKNNWTRDETLAFVRKSRPIADPNPAFMERLLEWEKRRR